MEDYVIYYTEGFNYRALLSFVEASHVDKSLNYMCASIPNGRLDIIKSMNGIKKVEKC